ncbi:MAG: cbb3-type cytochrome c oxidase N-terminal domain-containing protein [Flavobacteriaceae bacterium]|nr:c-type cytochrome [Mangrovimonas sp.]MCB0431498.1 c-type cytochrome [Mangrovimonas sp.]MCB0437449.1 c-type cytochrome [Mangrovimonas sp.]HPF95772.1 cbb3-type cytochrome c oxidase N-terminal domain-containing protein [Mangrovimonas sp.]HRV55902.1 cbb3-type cytochrome c oxidase N-terminal domain-containing protein [Mangrovimonas sp.]
MRNLIPSWVRVPLIFFAIFGLTEYVIDSGEKPAFIENPLVLLFLVLVLLVLVAIEGIVSSLDNILYQSLDEEGKARYVAAKTKSPKLFVWVKDAYKKLAGGKSIEEEHEIILDHNYDGIRELDNSLPPWWLYGFYASIVFAIVYLLRYHVFDAPGQFKELETEYAIAQKEIEEYKKTAKDLVDFETVTVLTDAADLANGKKIFEANCVACHKVDGGGGIGPNLTDHYWILGGGIKNVFHTITEGGRDGKGMIAWKQSLKPSEINQVASYVLTFQGTTPAEPKDPEGELWVDESASQPEGEATENNETETPAETTEIITDSVTVAQN